MGEGGYGTVKNSPDLSEIDVVESWQRGCRVSCSENIGWHSGSWLAAMGGGQRAGIPAAAGNLVCVRAPG